MTRLLPILLLALSCSAQQALLLSGGATVPLPAAGGPAITNTTAGLVNWWKFDENTGVTAADSAGSNNGTLTNGTVNPGSNLPLWGPGVINSGLYLQRMDLNGSGLVLATNLATSGAFTFSAWLYLSNNVTSSDVIIYDSNNASDSGIDIEIGPNSSVGIYIIASNVNLERHFVLSEGVWTFIAVTWTGVISDVNSLHAFTNAAEVVYTSSVAGDGDHFSNTTRQRSIGCLVTVNDIYQTEQSLNGRMDDVRFYTRALSSGELTNMYQWRGEP